MRRRGGSGRSPELEMPNDPRPRLRAPRFDEARVEIGVRDPAYRTVK